MGSDFRVVRQRHVSYRGCWSVGECFVFLLDKEAESMSGPIVRTGTTPEFWKNWDRAFGDKKKSTGDSKAIKGTDKSEGAPATKTTLKKAVKKAAKKTK